MCSHSRQKLSRVNVVNAYNMDSAVSGTETRPGAACRSVTILTEGQQRSDADWFVMMVVVGEFYSYF